MMLRPLAYAIFIAALFLGAMSLAGCERDVCGHLWPCQDQR
jgi:hypothetical protein